MKKAPDPRKRTGWQKRFYRGETKQCSVCHSNNWQGHLNCWSCDSYIPDQTGLAVSYKYGTATFGEKQNRDIQDYKAKNAADMIQPEIYNKHTRKVETNPEFTKRYGDPWKKRTAGKAVDKAVESGEITFKSDKDE